jgi:hypothetical protein
MFLLKTVPCLNDDFSDFANLAAQVMDAETGGTTAPIIQAEFATPDQAQSISSPFEDFFSTTGSKIGSTLVDVLDAYARKKVGLPVIPSARNPNYLYNADGSVMVGPGGVPVLRSARPVSVLSSIPTWAWIAGALGGAYLLTRRGR